MSINNRTLYKQKITKTVLEELNQPDQSSYEYAMQHWWYNKRRQGGFRLTQAGDTALTATGVDKYSFDIDFKNDDFTGLGGAVQLLLSLDKHLETPYYLYREPKNKTTMTLQIYDQKTAVLINLYGGFINWFKTLVKKNQDK